MIERLSALLGGLDEDGKILFDLGLANEFRKPLRAQMCIEDVFGFRFGCDEGSGHRRARLLCLLPSREKVP